MAQRDYDVLTHVGPDTPMGRLIRRYWIPAAMSEEVPASDPVRVRLLGEALVAYRDKDGRVGLVGEFCPHRLASLVYARNEGDGLRCLYHGWKICADGAVAEMPAEPPERKRHVRTRAYPTREAGGLVWTYMGSPELEPPFPRFPWLDLPADRVLPVKMYQECNYLQGVEGDYDPAHANFLHRDFEVEVDESWRGTGWDSMLDLANDWSPRIVCEDTPYGMHFAALRRTGDPAVSYVRTYETVMPFYCFIPSGPHESRLFKAWHAIDDTSCFTFYIHYDPHRPLDRTKILQNWGHETHPPDYRVPSNMANRHLQSRAAMSRNYSGIPGAAVQDLALQESMGPICDRGQENLGTSDMAVVYLRRMLLRLIEENEAGRSLPALDAALDFDLRGASLPVPSDVPWQQARAYQEELEARAG